MVSGSLFYFEDVTPRMPIKEKGREFGGGREKRRMKVSPQATGKTEEASQEKNSQVEYSSNKQQQ